MFRIYLLTRMLSGLLLILSVTSLTVCGRFELKESAPAAMADDRNGTAEKQELRIPFTREPDAIL